MVVAAPLAAVAEVVDVRPQVLLVAPRDSYRTAPFIEAARQRGIELVIASEGPQSLANGEASGVQIDLRKPAHALELLIATSRQRNYRGVIGTDDGSIELAAQVSARLELPHNPPEAVRHTRRKDLSRRHLQHAGIPVPPFWAIHLDQPLEVQLAGVSYPCVAKPVAMSASRGVIRANDRQELIQAIERIRLLLRPQTADRERETVLVEGYIPGHEVAVEGLLSQGQFELLAIFDKPDPLEGPYFEETYYITPSRHPRPTQQAIVERVAEACRTFGLREGPVHAECRINENGVWLLEVAARTIGGLCGRLLRFSTGLGLEETVLDHLLGRKIVARHQDGGAGVLMIPIPQAGILRRVEGLLDAQRVPYIEDLVIDVREGYELVPLPEGSSYLGFIFARAPSPEQAELALREAHAKLRVVVAPLWKVESG